MHKTSDYLIVGAGIVGLSIAREIKAREAGATIRILEKEPRLGAHADRVAHLAGVGQHYKLVPFKGLYYKLAPEVANRVRGSIYPVPDPTLPFLGIHFTRVISNEVYIDPTAIPAFGRENY